MAEEAPEDISCATLWSDQSGYPFRNRWLALWPFAALTFSAGVCLYSFGAAARRAANAPIATIPAPTTHLRAITRLTLQFVALTAAINAVALTPALFPTTVNSIDDFWRDKNGTLFVSSDYGNNGAEAKTTQKIYVTPIARAKTTTVTWFPNRPPIEELQRTVMQGEAIIYAPARLMIPPDRLQAMLLPADTPHTTIKPTLGLLITTLCALLLLHPTRELIAARRKRRA
jgi:hypothetical protein